MTRVLVAGAGVAAVECVLALRELAAARVSVELLAPAAELVHRPSSVKTPFGGEPAARIDLHRLARDLGVLVHADALASVQAEKHHVLTRDGNALPYDLLVVATGARSREAVPGAVTFRGPLSAGLVEQAIDRVSADPGLRLAFVAPQGVHWLLPLYELALLSAVTLRERGVAESDILVATGEHQPLEVFGPAASGAIQRELKRAGIELVRNAAAVSALDGALGLANGELLSADIVVALPEVIGPRIAGLPHDDAGFLPVDEHGHVVGCTDVFAAGDVTSFPVKHGGLAAQQADAVAEAIAARVGTVVSPAPFRPLLRGLLVTDERPLYLRAELGPGGQREHHLLPAPGSWSYGALWWPPGKVAGRYLTRFVATATASGRTLDDLPASVGPDGSGLILQAAEEDAAAGDYESAARALDDAEAWLGPLSERANERRDAWRRLIRR